MGVDVSPTGEEQVSELLLQMLLELLSWGSSITHARGQRSSTWVFLLNSASLLSLRSPLMEFCLW